jgi:NTP pyrophosphatase (non-canonical NTP hydrolase)
MNFEDYQTLASRTLDESKGKELAIINMALGISGESGEVADYLKKVSFQGHEFELEKLASELGDVLWYIAGMCTVLEIKLEEVAGYNIQKLMKRYPEGFKTENSVHREENNETN